LTHLPSNLMKNKHQNVLAYINLKAKFNQPLLKPDVKRLIVSTYFKWKYSRHRANVSTITCHR